MRLRALIQDAFTRRNLLFLFLYVGCVGFGYAAVLEFPEASTYVYLGFAAAFCVGIFWALLDMDTHEVPVPSAEPSRMEHRRGLCADPLCERCKGYYAGLTATVALVLSIHQRLLSALDVRDIHPLVVGGIGTALFFVATPLQGGVESLLRGLFGKPRPGPSSRRAFKALMGVVSGLALALVTLAVLAYLGP